MEWAKLVEGIHKHKSSITFITDLFISSKGMEVDELKNQKHQTSFIISYICDKLFSKNYSFIEIG